MSDKEEAKDKDYERIGRVMEAVVQAGYANKKRLILANFIRGLFFGLGATLGVSIILAILLFVLSLFTEIPFIGEIFESVKDTIKESQ